MHPNTSRCWSNRGGSQEGFVKELPFEPDLEEWTGSTETGRRAGLLSQGSSKNEDKLNQELRRRLMSGRSRQSTCEQAHKHKPRRESTGLSPRSHAFPSVKSSPGEWTPSEAPTLPAQDLHFLWDYYCSFKQQNDKIASCSGSLNHS